MSDSINTLILNALDDLKARDVTEVDVRDKSDVMDTMIIATGTSNRHIRSMAVKKPTWHRLAPRGWKVATGCWWITVIPSCT